MVASTHRTTRTATFPDLFDFAGHSGTTGHAHADVIDPELQDVFGSHVTVEFDMDPGPSFARAGARSCFGRPRPAEAVLRVCQSWRTPSTRRDRSSTPAPQRVSDNRRRKAAVATTRGQAVQHGFEPVVVGGWNRDGFQAAVTSGPRQGSLVAGGGRRTNHYLGGWRSDLRQDRTATGKSQRHVRANP